MDTQYKLSAQNKIFGLQNRDVVPYYLFGPEKIDLKRKK